MAKGDESSEEMLEEGDTVLHRMINDGEEAEKNKSCGLPV